MASDSDNYKNLMTFFNEEYHSLRAFARSRIDDTAERDAEDIVQEVALKMFSRAATSSPIDNIAGFVYNSIRNKIIDIMRTRKEVYPIEKEMEMKLHEFSELLYGKSANSYSDQMKGELKRAIVKLKPIYKEIIIAIDFEGYTYKEVAIETGISEGTLMSRRHRALSILLTSLENIKEINN